MGQVGKILKNFSFMSGSRVVSRVVDFGFFVLAASYLGPADFGVLTTALAFVSVFSIFLSFGASSVVIREVARDKDQTAKYANSVLTLRLILGIVLCPVIVLLGYLTGYSTVILFCVAILSINILFKSVTNGLRSVFNAHERMEFESLSQITVSIGKLVAAGLAIYLNEGVLWFAFVYLSANILSFVLTAVIYTWKFELISLSTDIEFSTQLIRISIPFALSGGLVTIYNNIDKVMISKLVSEGSTAVGYYSPPYKIVMGLIGILSPLVLSLYPVMSKTGDENELDFILNRLFRYVSIISLPVGVGTVVVAEEFILLTFGQEYQQSSVLLQILIWNFVLISLTWPHAYLFKSIDKQVVNLKSSVLEVITNISLNTVLILTVGYTGAAVATVLTALTAFIYLNISMNWEGYGLRSETIVHFSKVALAAVGMGLVVSTPNIGLFLQVPLGILVYPVLLIILDTFDEKDEEMMERLSVPVLPGVISSR